MVANRCYECGYTWETDDINEPCPNCNSHDSDNFNDDEVRFKQHDFEDEDCEVTVTEIVDEEIKQETE